MSASGVRYWGKSGRTADPLNMSAAINGLPMRRLQATLKGQIRPTRSFKFTDANVCFRITKLTLPTKRSLCATAIGSIVRFLRHKRTLAMQTHLVAS